MDCDQSSSCASDWAGLHGPLLQHIALLVLGQQTLTCAHYLVAGSSEANAAQNEQRKLATLSLVCHRWHQAVAAALAHSVTWAVAVQHTALPAGALQRLEQLRVSELDLRQLTWGEAATAAGVEALLTSPAFCQQSRACLRRAVGVPERLVSILATFANLKSVGLSEDYDSTAVKPHGAPMQLAPLHGSLPRLTWLQLEHGIVDLAALPPQLAELALVEADRLLLPPMQGTSVADRLLATAEAQGLSRFSLQAASGSVVFEEAGHAPLELELSHVARLLVLAARGGAWRVELSVQSDLQQRMPRLTLTRI